MVNLFQQRLQGVIRNGQGNMTGDDTDEHGKCRFKINGI